MTYQTCTPTARSDRPANNPRERRLMMDRAVLHGVGEEAGNPRKTSLAMWISMPRGMENRQVDNKRRGKEVWGDEKVRGVQI